ncbi:AAA family ATPase [Desulfocurvibacter africanus]|uniref:AAA family ATPase n=1 Tax=Desulfocurvibacter africanus TaxID=873 RepID=UPI00040652C4|nr:AAA family ATPase [Desulfocurvibacter africanus]
MSLTIINTNPQYNELGLIDFQDNPLVEALPPPPKSKDDILQRLMIRPEWNPEEVNLPDFIRYQAITRLHHFLFPIDQHVKIYSSLYGQILDGYRYRNPLHTDTQMQLYGFNEASSTNSRGILRPNSSSSISFISGISGLGKSTLVKSILHSFGPQVIKHSIYNNKQFYETQIVCLMRNVPDQCSVKSLCRSFGYYTDILLNTNLYSIEFSDKHLTRNHYIHLIHKIIRNFHVGIVVIDEFQNVSISRSGGKKEVLAFIINLFDELGVPIVIIGTPNAKNILSDNVSVIRRFTTGGFHELRRPDAPGNKNDDTWETFCKVCWDYQWLKNPKEINEEIIHTLYDCSQGIFGIMLRIFTASQVVAIEQKKETLSSRLIRNVYLSEFSMLHKVIDAIRSGDLSALSLFEDLYSTAFKGNDTSTIVNRLALLSNQIRPTEDKLHNLDQPLPENTHTRQYSGKHNKQSIEELRDAVLRNKPKS